MMYIPGSIPASASIPAPLRVLVVDDEPSIRRTTRRLLEIDGHRVAEAPDGSIALMQLAAQPFDVVLTDLTMPNLDGWELIRQIRRAGSRAPAIIAASGAAWEDDPDMVARAAELGVAALLTKPYTQGRLRWAVLETLKPTTKSAAFLPGAA